MKLSRPRSSDDLIGKRRLRFIHTRKPLIHGLRRLIDRAGVGRVIDCVGAVGGVVLAKRNSPQIDADHTDQRQEILIVRRRLAHASGAPARLRNLRNLRNLWFLLKNGAAGQVNQRSRPTSVPPADYL